MNLRLINGAFRKAFSVFTKHRKTISWFSEKRIKHQPYGVEHSFSYNNFPIYYISPGEFLHAGDEIFEKEIYKIKFATNNPLVIDCGANIGLSVLYFKHIAPHAKIISVEPDTVNYNLLEKTQNTYPMWKILKLQFGFTITL